MMKLSDALRAFASNTNLTITLIDRDGNTLISFNATGYASIESDLYSYEITEIKINSSKEVALTLGEVIP